MRRLLLIALVAQVVVGCGRKARVVEAPRDAAAETAPPMADTPPGSIALDLLALSPRCRIEHRGAFIDIGTPEAAWASPGHPDLADMPGFERDGATFGRVLDRSQSFTFALEQPGAALVAVRGRARGSKKVTVSVDGKLVGTIALSATEDRVASATNNGLNLAAGLHTLTLRWVGAVKKEEPVAELDWIRVGTVDGETSAYAAPTRRDAVTQVVLGGAPRRAYTLMAPAVVRCVAFLPKGASFVADVGAVSEGTSGEVEVRARTAGSESAKVIAHATASATGWSGISAPIASDGEGLAVIEIAITKGPKQGRVAIAEPRIVRATMPEKVAPRASSQTVIVVVLAGLRASNVAMPSLQKLAREGVVYKGHRAPSLLGSSSVASLVTGMPVAVHALEDSGARLSPRTPLVPRTLTPFGVASAMFTEVPTTGPAFGFAHDWNNYAARSPLDGASVAFDEITKWLDTHAGKKAFVVAHARGAHPPWDITAEAMKTLPPEGYAGSIDPKHVVPVLAKAKKGLLRVTPADHVRMVALMDNALATQDKKLDALIESMRQSGVLDKTTLIVTGDAPFVLPQAVPDPTKEAPPPESPEDPLSIPLVIRFPNAYAAGKVVQAVTDPTDVATTIVAAFGGPLEGLFGRDLATLALDDEPARDVPRLSDDGRGYQLAWGDLRLVGAWEKVPRLEPRVGNEDLRAKRPYEYLAAWGLAAEARALWLTARAKGPGREPATIDPATQAALDSWERSR